MGDTMPVLLATGGGLRDVGVYNATYNFIDSFQLVGVGPVCPAFVC